jgi:manganese oxidase
MRFRNHLVPSVRARTRALFIALGAWLCAATASQAAATCTNTVTANVVALDQPFFWNRMGAVEPQGMVFALRRDVVPIPGYTLDTHAELYGIGATALAPGQVQLRTDKRPRPMVLRMHVGDCLQINFQNLLAPTPPSGQTGFDEQPSTRTAGVHVVGMDLVGGVASDGSNVGRNASSLVPPGGTAQYTFYAEREGGHLLYSTAANTGGEGNGGSLDAGLFGAVIVEPKSSEWYRSQITNADMKLATTGTTPDGHPIINYQAVYPAGHPRAGLPILRMTQGNEIVDSDLTAVITGPSAGRFPAGTYTSTPVNPDREQPFREFTIIYHDEVAAVQAFKAFSDPAMLKPLASVKDGFAINYGTGGIGAEILSNRMQVGPAAGCTECKFEEFFLSSWALGDPAMVVDVPANASTTGVNTGGLPINPAGFPNQVLAAEKPVGCLAGDAACGASAPTVQPGMKATKALFPDDPSNVYHSYLADHTKFRILHGGAKEHHIHHQHAHQWVHTPDSSNSSYDDSQAIGPGAAFTLEITYNGGGNRNKTVGDSIFHCHFYPHFAQGMWALFRTHDVFEAGTALDANGRPAPGSRALPDAEIQTGTPIAALLPLPTLPMAPMPSPVQIVGGQVQVGAIPAGSSPGYPFFVAGVAGHRPPHPPLDTIDTGGLPRHVITGGTFTEQHDRLSFDKALVTAKAQAVPEQGTPTEQAEMNYLAVRNHATYRPDGTTGTFVTNGLPRQPGAPFADPCVDDNGNAVGVPRLYKAADIQLDVKLNKSGWHNPQQRFGSLWEDVAAYRAGTRPPQPLFFRANTNDCITYQLTNLMPSHYEQDAFQVRTPTDIVGQHIHLVKFDVLASDGAGNGWNYEDGSFSPDEVIERIKAINAAGGLTPFGGGVATQLTVQNHPFFGTPGAQTTVQRWYADATLNNAGQDRTLRTVFTHDHFGPSTHQQAGLYMGLVVEPQGSSWRDPETGAMFGTGRQDGGPTSWRADILTANPADSYREFLLELADYQVAYDANNKPINPPFRVESGLPKLLTPASVCPGTNIAPPCPEVISADDVGTMVVNYRNEPIPMRVRDPATNKQAAGDAGDLSQVFSSLVTRADPAYNTQPGFYPPLTGGVQPQDPFTPLLRVYPNDRVQIRALVGAHEEGHNFSVSGTKWLREPSEPNSGWRASQMMGISEHFEFAAPVVAVGDLLYRTGTSVDDQWNGMWGLMRPYTTAQPDLLALPNNPAGGPRPTATGFNGPCPPGAPARSFSVTAVAAATALPGGKLVYNSRANQGGALNDPTAILFVRSSDLTKTDTLKPGVPIEPLVLRAAAGECITVTLLNHLPATQADLPGFNTMPMIVDGFNANDVVPSSQVGLHPQLVSYDVRKSDGMAVGTNGGGVQPPKNGAGATYTWYAGDLSIDANNNAVGRPIEYGAINLSSSDPIKHSNKGAIGALIIEPQGSTWVEDAGARSSATVTKADGTTFRDFVVQIQNDVNLRYGDGTAVPTVALEEDSEDSGHKAINYRTEPMWKRMGYAPETALDLTRTLDFTNALSNAQVGGDPETPIFTAKVGTPTRFHFLEPGGHGRDNVMEIHGHAWQEEPYVNGSTAIGDNVLSEWLGASMGHGPSNHVDAPLQNGAGGKFGVTGDYLYRTFQSFQFDGGIWGIFRVTP